NFTRIAQDTSTNSWTLWRQDGTRLIYSAQLGDTASPATTLRWALTKIIDTHQNQVNYDYTCDAVHHACYLNAISYGEGGPCEDGHDQPGARIQFYWESRPDPQSVAQGRFLEEMTQRLRAIDVTEGGERVRVYQLTYQDQLPDEHGYRLYRSWLASIQVFGS